jgi:membrane-associated PAP2 superfamily phosphatase
LNLQHVIRENPIAVALLGVVALSAFFLAFPGIDLWFSDLFHRNRGGFWLRRNDLLGLFRATNDVLIGAIVVALFASVAVKIARPDRPSPIQPNVVVFLLSTLVLGPLLLVNVILKNSWGRPRPIQVDAFGGDAPYVEVWRITDWCHSNCSFVSGEASSAIWFVAVALVLPRRFRTAAVALAAAYAGLLSLNRIAFGGHFLSDVLISFALTLLVIAILYRVVIQRPPHWLGNATLERGLTRLGQALRGRPGSID